MKFSPGPWEVNGEGFHVCHCGNSSIDGQDYEVTMNGLAARDGVGESDAKNDAYLIAAAPDLFSALESIFKYCTFENVSDWRQMRRDIGEIAGQALKKVKVT